MEAGPERQSASRGPTFGKNFLLTPQGWPYLLLPFIPLAIALELATPPRRLVFFSAALGVIPTAALMGRATEELAARSGPGVGGLLNVTFGNAPELIIALFALGDGLQEVVKASIIGSILGNVLLVLGAAMLVGGLKDGKQVQKFDHTAASVQSLMLFLAAAALVMPAIYELVEGQGLPGVSPERVSYDPTVETSRWWSPSCYRHLRDRALLLACRTHRELFNPEYEEARRHLGLVLRTLGDRAGGRRHRGRGDVGDPGRLDRRDARSRSG